MATRPTAITRRRPYRSPRSATSQSDIERSSRCDRSSYSSHSLATRNFTRQLDEQQIAVYVTDPRDLEGIFRSIAVVGDLLGQREEGERVSVELRARAARVEEAIKSRTPLRVFYQLSAEPLYTAGHDSYITDLIARAGGRSVTANVRERGRATVMRRRGDPAEAIVMATGGSMAEANRDIAAA